MSRHVEKIKKIVFKGGEDKNEKIRILDTIFSYKDKDILAIYNPESIGIMNSTKDMFENTLGIKEIYNVQLAQQIAQAIIDSNIKQVVFSSIAFGWKAIAEELNILNPDIKIKFFWHGSHSMLVQRDEPYFFYSIIELLDRGIAHSIGFAKESMAQFYKIKGYNSFFVPNTLKGLKSDTKYERIDGVNKIGLYSAGSRWEKNTYNQLSATSLIENALVDLSPSSELSNSFCDMMNINLVDRNLKYMKRQDLLDRMANNDVNLYVTFTECSPVLPLESLELGVPCITGDNHHYFRGSKLYDYLVVHSEDDINEIADKAKKAIENREEIISLYKKWKVEYDEFVKQKLEEFIVS